MEKYVGSMRKDAEIIEAFAGRENFRWSFIPPRAPNFDGVSRGQGRKRAFSDRYQRSRAQHDGVSNHLRPDRSYIEHTAAVLPFRSHAGELGGHFRPFSDQKLVDRFSIR